MSCIGWLVIFYKRVPCSQQHLAVGLIGLVGLGLSFTVTVVVSRVSVMVRPGSGTVSVKCLPL